MSEAAPSATADTSASLPVTWRGRIAREWVDYNGHLRDAFYLLLFSYGTDGLMDMIGLDEAGRDATGHSMFTLECHLNFVHEVKDGAQVEVRTRILAMDAKRVQILHTLHPQGGDELLAASEQMQTNVDLRGGARSSAFAPAVLARLQPMADAHRALPAAPPYVGRLIALPRPRTA